MSVPGPGTRPILGTPLTPMCLQPRAVTPHPDEPSFPKDTRLSLRRPKAHRDHVRVRQLPLRLSGRLGCREGGCELESFLKQLGLGWRENKHNLTARALQTMFSKSCHSRWLKLVFWGGPNPFSCERGLLIMCCAASLQVQRNGFWVQGQASGFHLEIYPERALPLNSWFPQCFAL